LIFIGGKLYSNGPDFSDRFRLISGMISGATQWLNWAINDKDFWLSVSSEEELLSRIQEGLHGSGLMCIDELDLLVNPLRLAQMNDKDLEVIAQKENPGNDEKVKNVLDANGLKTRENLDMGIKFLEELEIAENLIFRIMPLSDQIRIFDLLKGNQPLKSKTDAYKKTQKEAADFALLDAQTPLEFSDRYQFYFAAIEKAKKNAGAAGKLKILTDAWDNLSRLCNRLLETFSFNRKPYNRDLVPEIRNSILNGFKIGFLSKASAIKNIMMYTSYISETGNEAEVIIDEYMTETEDLIRQGNLDRFTISQDGMIRSFVFIESTGSDKKATVNVDALGVVTISSCQV
jgi:hypothetical protein